jgi:osmotically inducible protein OsmC
MKSTASAEWRGSLKTGKGSLTAKSGVLADTPYSFQTRFEGAAGTNPEELLAAAHAGCFSMALSAVLGEEGIEPKSLATRCTITLDKKEEGFAITKSHLELTAKVPGATEKQFQAAAKKAKENCPVSKLFHTEITLDAKLGN